MARGRQKGYTMTKEHKQKISDKKIGVPQTEQHRKHISEAKTGLKFSIDHIKNLTEAQRRRRTRERSAAVGR